MKILAVETSAGPASCAVWEDGKILAQSYINNSLTHSQTLMPMIETMLTHTQTTLNDVDYVAVSVGPGSFTGIRIGVAAVKGLAFAKNIPCIPVSTLAAIAQNAAGIPYNGIVCAAMDARCNQVYTACFLSENGTLSRLTDDEAIPLEELKIRLISYKKMIFCVGDGAKLCYNYCKESVPELFLASAHLQYQNATGVAVQAAQQAQSGAVTTHETLQPFYLRLPQAERELKQKQQLLKNGG